MLAATCVPSLWRFPEVQTPNILMPSAETAYSSLTTRSGESLGFNQGLNNFVVRNWSVGSGCQGNGNLGQLRPSQIGQGPAISVLVLIFVSFLL